MLPATVRTIRLRFVKAVGQWPSDTESWGGGSHSEWPGVVGSPHLCC